MPRAGAAGSRVSFGATVTYRDDTATHTVSIVGGGEIDLHRRYISWMSPLGRALMKASPGDRVLLREPGRTVRLQILDVDYAPIPMDPFQEPAR